MEIKGILIAVSISMFLLNVILIFINNDKSDNTKNRYVICNIYDPLTDRIAINFYKAYKNYIKHPEIMNPEDTRYKLDKEHVMCITRSSNPELLDDITIIIKRHIDEWDIGYTLNAIREVISRKVDLYYDIHEMNLGSIIHHVTPNHEIYALDFCFNSMGNVNCNSYIEETI